MKVKEDCKNCWLHVVNQSCYFQDKDLEEDCPGSVSLDTDSWFKNSEQGVEDTEEGSCVELRQ